jgi:Ca-activated chloride channel homolog
MINMQTNLEKNALHKGEQETLLLVELNSDRTKIKKTENKKLNVSIVLDISTSMNQAVKNQKNNSHYDDFIKKHIKQINEIPSNQPKNPWNKPNPFEPMLQPIWHDRMYQTQCVPFEPMSQQHIPTKMSQAIDAAKKAIMQMKDGDFLSLVLFDHEIHILQEAIELNSTSRMIALQKLDTVKTSGSTNLHGGWLAGATEVAKKMSADALNRVIILTDGQTNAGVRDPEHICKDVNGLYQKSISTTTFGIGLQFNEDLLQKMATSGGGNFYYINDDNQLSQMFADEFGGLNNTCATEIKLTLNLHKDAQVVSNLNDFSSTNNVYNIPDMVYNNKMNGLFKIKINVAKKTKSFDLGTVSLSFKLADGTHQTITSELKYDVLNQKNWDSLAFHEEVKVQEMLLVVAQNKLQAIKSIDMGDINGAKSFLSRSANLVGACGMSDSRLSSEITSLNQTLSCADSIGTDALRKDISYQSYKTRFNKLDPKA